MDHKENFAGINLNIEAPGITLDDDIKDRIKKAVNRLSRYYEKIEYAQVFMQDKKEKSTLSKQVSIRLGIPGNDAFASDYGDNFHICLKNVEEKLRRQLEKNK